MTQATERVVSVKFPLHHRSILSLFPREHFSFKELSTGVVPGANRSFIGVFGVFSQPRSQDLSIPWREGRAGKGPGIGHWILHIDWLIVLNNSCKN